MTVTVRSAFGYPIASPHPEQVTIGRVTYLDPFKWLEEDTEQVLVWQSAQDAFAENYLSGLPALCHFSELLAKIGEADVVSVPKFAGGRWFKQYVPDGKDLAVIGVADTPTGSGRCIIDLNNLRKGEPLILAGFIPSPDGSKIIFSWSAGGHEELTIRLVDVDSGETVLDGLPHRQPTFFTWLPDSSGFLYTAMDSVLAGGPPLFRLLLERPLRPTPESVKVDHPVIRPIPCADRRHILLAVDHLAPRLEYILDTKSNDGWKPFLKGIPGMFRGDVLGDSFIAITDDGAARGRLVSIPLSTPTDRGTWREIVPGSENMLGQVVVTAGRAVLLDLVDTYARIRVFDASGTLEGEIELPGRGTVNSMSSSYVFFTMMDQLVSAEDGQLIFFFSSFDQPPALYRAEVATRQITQLSRPETNLAVQVLDLVGRSADGARVSYHVVARSDLDLSKPQPTVVHGYGGFNVSVTPGWLGARWAAWIEAGGIIVLAHLRGGGEYGTNWWKEGRLKLKQNSFADVHAVAEDLIKRGIATPHQLGVIGESNGGAMAAAVAIQRPDLYRASVPQVPITDALGRTRDAVSMMSTLDYGDPADPEMAEILLDWSPYQNVRDGIAYPALLIDCGANDARCPPWHGRKFAARVQQATSGGLPVLLRVRADAGHVSGGAAQKQVQSAEVLAFLADQLGLVA